LPSRLDDRRAPAAILIVIDGLTPSTFEAAIGDRDFPTLTFLAEAGDYRQATTTFPSLTPVCLTSIATGTHPDAHRIPHLVWWHRGEQRIVEYGSSFAAIRAAGTRRSIRDSIIGMNQEHLARDVTTIYEDAEDAGLVAAAVNMTCYRGRTRYLPTVPGLAQATLGPKRFFYYNLFESDPTGAPLSVRNRAAGTVDDYAAAVGRWLVTRDGFDLLVYYLSDLDFASHVHGPDGTRDALCRSDRAVQALVDAAGGRDAFLERYAILLCSDHGQTHVHRAERLDVPGIVTASNRAAMVYTDVRRPAAEQLDRLDSVDLVVFLEDGDVVARRDGDEDSSLLDEYPNGRERVEAALRNPNAGEVIASAAEGWEFADLAGGHHAGGGSHGSLAEGDSLVPMLGIGIGALPARTVDVKESLLSALGIAHAAAA
jgi:predicted AlkP superfamily pyrophosphatase or phosphodiesterase